MLFNFELTPLREVEPWGIGDNRKLHWFGLTDGCFWIDVGDQRLFEYSDAARGAGATPYCSYQVIRLYEDVLDMTPDVLEPVPRDLACRISGAQARRSELKLSEWWKRNAERDDDDFWSTLEDARTWIQRRHLDSGYLSPGIDVVMWSDTGRVHIEWDNSLKRFDGSPAWTAGMGSFSLPRDQFIEEVRSFHERLISRMAERVEQVLKGDVLAPDVQIDLPGLRQEQIQRSGGFERAFDLVRSTDWDATRKALAVVDASDT